MFEARLAACIWLVVSALLATSSLARRSRHNARFACNKVRGEWCRAFHEQEPIPWRPPPVGSKFCPSNCSSRGNCQAATGLCYCPAGWTGPDCATPQKRPCTNRPGDPMSWQPDNPQSFIGAADHLDLDLTNPGHTSSRCAGWCDDDLGWCWCHQGKYAHLPPPPGSPPGTPPAVMGRPYMDCSPSDDDRGAKVLWQHAVVSGSWNSTFRGDGWCNAPQPTTKCPCPEGFHGGTCSDISDHFCVNQCSGKGLCYHGFCNCFTGWYGHDCSLRVGAAVEPEQVKTDMGNLSSWLTNLVHFPPAALDLPPRPTRLRPLIYVYDLEPLYNAKLLQYRAYSGYCTHRFFVDRNVTLLNDQWLYAVETLLHESLIQSAHRTMDPEEADFFYVPIYMACFPYPLYGWADWPWFGGVGGPRVKQMAVMALDAKNWIQTHLPYYNRSNGRDHIWFWAHDEGACYAPTELYQGIMLTHWGRMDKEHVSGTAHEPDNYTLPYSSAQLPSGWLHLIQGHPCYDPSKDLVLPSFKQPKHHLHSPYFGAPVVERDILLFLRGDVGKGRLPHYSRGVRQKLFNLTVQHKWTEKYNIQIGDRTDVQGDYSKLLARSKFCVVTGGDGWSGRAEDAVLHGCVPVVIMDNVHPPFGSILDWPSFSVRLSENEVDENLPGQLFNIAETNLWSLQANLSQVWHRFQWASAKAVKTRLQTMVNESSARHLLPGTAGWRQLVKSDAFHTIMQWLYSKMETNRPEGHSRSTKL